MTIHILKLGDLRQEHYDTNRDGILDQARDLNTDGRLRNTFYGINTLGNKGFYRIDFPEIIPNPGYQVFSIDASSLIPEKNSFYYLSSSDTIEVSIPNYPIGSYLSISDNSFSLSNSKRIVISAIDATIFGDINLILDRPGQSVHLVKRSFDDWTINSYLQPSFELPTIFAGNDFYYIPLLYNWGSTTVPDASSNSDDILWEIVEPLNNSFFTLSNTDSLTPTISFNKAGFDLSYIVLRIKNTKNPYIFDTIKIGTILESIGKLSTYARYDNRDLRNQILLFNQDEYILNGTIRDWKFFGSNSIRNYKIASNIYSGNLENADFSGRVKANTQVLVGSINSLYFSFSTRTDFTIDTAKTVVFNLETTSSNEDGTTEVNYVFPSSVNFTSISPTPFFKLVDRTLSDITDSTKVVGYYLPNNVSYNPAQPIPYSLSLSF